MKWPERPTCHDSKELTILNARQYYVWHRGEAYPSFDGNPRIFRTCGYCGSMHPEDLIAALKDGAKLHGFDWKYGWPHKFYIDNIPNPNADRIIEVGSDSRMVGDRRVTTPIMGREGLEHGKWYNDHLLDVGYDDEAFGLLLATSSSTAVSRSRLKTGTCCIKHRDGGIKHEHPLSALRGNRQRHPHH